MTVEAVRLTQRDNAIVAVSARIAALRILDALRDENRPFILHYSTFAGRAVLMLQNESGPHAIYIPSNRNDLDLLVAAVSGDKPSGAWWLDPDADHVSALRYTLTMLCAQAFEESVAALRRVEAETLPVGMRLPIW